ncbi:MAG: bacteriohemerythrin [Spirochaetota bacterium]|jgi:hemerythrin|nr:bacteriohemerythrin [Spirochaetota bacterium]
MALLTWDDSLSVKIPEVDEEHKVLVKLINELHTAMKEGRGREGTEHILNELVTYTQTHFTHEEAFLTRNNYPQLAPHKLMHQTFVEKVVAFQKEFTAGKLVLSIQLVQFLSDWIVEHVKKADMQYGKMLAGKKY